MDILKRDGRKAKYDKDKINQALTRCFLSIDENIDEESQKLIDKIVTSIDSIITKTNKDLTVEEIQDLIEKKLMSSNRKDVARAFITYRNERTRIREHKTVLIKNVPMSILQNK